MISPVNTENPRSGSHVLPILEFVSDVKDTSANKRTTCFGREDFVQKGSEHMINPRCILLKVEIGGKLQVPRVKNTGVANNCSHPKALTQNLSGHTDHVQP